MTLYANLTLCDISVVTKKNFFILDHGRTTRMLVRFRIYLVLLLVVIAPNVWAQTEFNTYGSTPGVAIDGYDTVAFFSEKKAVKGSAAISHDWNNAKWHFSTEANRAAFAAEPDKFAPQYGGYCALNVAYGQLSKKPVSGEFEVYKNKLYLFGSASGSMTPKTNWWQSGPYKNIRDADKEWVKLRKELE